MIRSSQRKRLARNYRTHSKVKTLNAWVWPGNIELLFEDHGVPKDFDLLVIDIDSNDYYVWHAIQSYRPKVVMIETNPMFQPPTRMVIEYHPMNYWDGSSYFGASLQSLFDLGRKKGYRLVYHLQNGVHAIFVDEPYFERFGIQDNSPETLDHAPELERLERFESRTRGTQLRVGEFETEKVARDDR